MNCKRSHNRRKCDIISEWSSTNRSKHLLQYHIIFVCKYRRRVLTTKLSEYVKQLSYDVSLKNRIVIKEMETDRDHIHYFLELPPSMAVCDAVSILKSYTTYHLWEQYGAVLAKTYWGKNKLWTDGYFACSVGNVSAEKLKAYIANQG